MQRKHYSSCSSRKLILFPSLDFQILPFLLYSHKHFSEHLQATFICLSLLRLLTVKLKRRSATYQFPGFRLHFHSSMLSCVPWEATRLQENCISRIPPPNGFQLPSTNWRHWQEIRRHEEGNNILCASAVQQRWQWWQTSLDSRHPAQAVGIPATKHLQTLVPVATMTAVDKFRLNFLQRNPDGSPNNTSMECSGNGVRIVDVE